MNTSYILNITANMLEDLNKSWVNEGTHSYPELRPSEPPNFVKPSSRRLFEPPPHLKKEYHFEDTDEWTLWINTAVTVYYIFILVLAVLGNTTTCVVIVRHKHMRTVTNCYLFSLAISDLLLLVSGLPPELHYMWSSSPHVFSEAFCVLDAFISEMSTNATVLTITAFTVERFVAICFPFHTHKVSTLSRALRCIAVIWVLSACLTYPLVTTMGLVLVKDKYGNVISEYASCSFTDSLSTYNYFFLSTVLSFLLPLVLISVLYILIGVRLLLHRRKTRRESQPRLTKEVELIVRQNRQHNSTKRVVWMLVAVVASFFICWTPYHVQRLYVIHGHNGGDLDMRTFTVLRYVSGILFCLSTAINPVLYSLMSLRFRQAFKSSVSQLLGSFRSETTEVQA